MGGAPCEADNLSGQRKTKNDSCLPVRQKRTVRLDPPFRKVSAKVVPAFSRDGKSPSRGRSSKIRLEVADGLVPEERGENSSALLRSPAFEKGRQQKRDHSSPLCMSDQWKDSRWRRKSESPGAEGRKSWKEKGRRRRLSHPFQLSPKG